VEASLDARPRARRKSSDVIERSSGWSEAVRGVISGVVAGVIAAILLVLGGAKPLPALIAALVVSVLVWIAFERRRYVRALLSRHAAMGRDDDGFYLRLNLGAWSRRGPSTAESERGWLDYERDGYDASLAAVKVLQRMPGEIVWMNKQLAAKPAVAAGSDLGLQHRSVTRMASKIDRFARRMEGLEVAYRRECAAMTTNWSARFATATRPVDAAAWIPVLSTTGEQTRAGRQAMEEYRLTVVGLRNLGITEAMNRATDRLVEVLGRIMEDTDGVISYCGESIVRLQGAGA
jgi:hypothetical protein